MTELRTSGFEIFPSVLARTEIAHIAEALQSESIERSRAGARHLMHHAVVKRLAYEYASAPAAALSRVIALRLHIDDSGPDNGALRVLPGTHTQGVLSDAVVAQLPRDVQAVDCVATAGGVVAMRPLLVHASRLFDRLGRRAACVTRYV